MSSTSAIEWTDATWNPVTGCSKVSPGCAHCYIERTPAFRIARRRFVQGVIPVELHDNRLDQPLHWRKPRRVFVNSLSDLYHDAISDEFIGRVFETMRRAHWHRFQILTKRSHRLRQLCSQLPWSTNVWQGVSVENAAHVHRIADLRQVPAAVRFLSLEPLLGPIPHLTSSPGRWGLDSRQAGLPWQICRGLYESHGTQTHTGQVDQSHLY